MKKNAVVEFRRPRQGQDLLSTMLREGAQRLVAQAVQAEFDEFLARFLGKRVKDGRAAVVRNGFQPERDVLTGPGCRAHSEGALDVFILQAPFSASPSGRAAPRPARSAGRARPISRSRR